MEQISEILLGPLGGSYALGLITGAPAAYAFAMRIVAKYKLPALEAEIQALSKQITELTKALKNEQERYSKLEELLNGPSSGSN